MTRTGTVSDMQKRSWGFYGVSGSNNLPVPEVRYVVGWRADQMTRLDWDVRLDGSDVWSVDNPNATPENKQPTTISTTREDGEQDVTAASAELLDLIDWNDTNIRAVDTNIFVGGQGDYIKERDQWRVVSVVESKRKETLANADEVVPFIWAHPADPKKPDAPLFSVLELLDELEWLNRQARAQSRQRVLINGVVVTADSLEGPDGKSFWDVWNETLSARMADPDDLSPVRLQAPSADVREGALDWVLPPFGYDQTIDRRVLAAIQRLAWGLPIPPEILLGMQAQSRATAFQVEENAYRAHIEPPAWLVAQVAQDALTRILDDREVEVVPNPSAMLARKNSVEDVKWAKAEGLADDTYTREVLGIPDAAAPVDEEDMDPAVKTALDMAVAAPSLAQVPGLPDLVAQIRSIVDGTPYVPVANPSEPDAPIATDPANDAADEPVTAANTTGTLSELLADIDAHLSSELAGATVMATDRARQRLGAAARSNQYVRNDAQLKGLSSSQVATQLGMDGLTAAGVKVMETIAEPIDAAARWWTNRITQAWEQASTLVPGWSGQGAWVEESVDALDVALGEHIINTLSDSELSPLEAEAIRGVVDAAAGGNGVR